MFLMKMFAGFHLRKYYSTVCVVAQAWLFHLIRQRGSAVATVRDTDNWHFSADTPRRFSEDIRAAMCRLSSDLCNAKDVHG